MLPTLADLPKEVQKKEDTERELRQRIADLEKQARTAEYDQGTAGQAIDTFSDFIQMYPDDPRISQAEKIIVSLKLEQAHGNYQTAKYYESRRQWMGARIYYNEVVSKDPSSPYAGPSLQRIAELNKLIGNSSR